MRRQWENTRLYKSLNHAVFRALAEEKARKIVLCAELGICGIRFTVRPTAVIISLGTYECRTKQRAGGKRDGLHRVI